MATEKAKLSKNVLQMKFMQRSVLRMEEEKNLEEKQRVIDDEHWVLDLPQLTQREEKYITQPSFNACESLLFGRMSFKEFNPEVEKLMKIHNTNSELEEAEEREQETALTATEMANRYSALVGSISKKFTTKKRRREMTEKASDDSDDNTSEEDDSSDDSIINEAPPKAKKKFLKPKDD